MHLYDWENRFKPFVPNIELLAEIPLRKAEHVELEVTINAFVKKLGLAEATRRLQHEYPISFITYLAFKAAFNEERGFWAEVAHGIGVGNPQLLFNPAHHWGQNFLEILENYKLRSFSGISGLEYVTPIRLHGGISSFSLPDYFKHILLPSVQGSHYSGLDDRIVLTALLDHYTVELFVDDIVRYFFRHGGEPAFHFFQKCRNMARLAVQGDPLPSVDQLGLRPYVLQAFENYLQNPPEPSQRRRLPRLLFQPYEPAFRIFLPSHPVPFEQAGSPHFWRIRCITNGEECFVDEERVRVRHPSQEWQTDESEYILTEPAEHVQVSLICRSQSEEKIILKHSIRLLPASGSTPLLAFRENGTKGNPPCHISPALPAHTLWLFYPSDVELHFEGEARRDNELHPFPVPWDAWQAHAWDLSKVRLIRLLCFGKDVCPPVPVTTIVEPELLGHSIHPQSLPVDEKPLFLGTPLVRLPLRNLQDPTAELRDWHLTLESRYAAEPDGKWEGTANELPYEVQHQDGSVLLVLKPWLGEKPVGTYHLQLRGPARTELELPFRTWHDIQIEGLQPYYLPGSQGAEEVLFHIQLPEKCQLTTLQENVHVQKTQKGWQVRVDDSVDQVKLGLEYFSQPEVVRVPFNLTIPRLRWALQFDPSAVLEWQSSPLRFPLAKLLQSRSPRLRVELPLMEQKTPLIALHLTVPGRSEPIYPGESLELKQFQYYLEFKLDSYSDTLRAHMEQSVFDFVLELLDASSDLLISLPVIRLTQELDVHVCHFEMIDGNWRIHWHEPHPLRHRRLRLWPLWQPWSEAAEIRMPDDAPPSDNIETPGWWMIDLPTDIGLPPSKYKAQFLAAAPDDAPPLPQEPPENTICINLIDARERLAQIEQELSLHPTRTFVLHAEKACIYDSENQIADRDESTRWCLSHWNDANLLHMLGFQRWLESRDQITRRAFLMHMFRAEILEKLQTYPDDFTQKYLALIRDAKTIKPESAWLILMLAKGPEVIARALEVLLNSQDVKAIEYIWDEFQAGRFSDTDAAQVLSVQASLAVEELLKQEDTPLRTRLLVELSRKHPLPKEIVWAGYWVHSDAGWGKIIEIQNTDRPDFFFPGKEKPRLLVDLWNSQIRIEIDLRSRYITMGERKSAYLCGCKQLIAPRGQDFWDVWEQHEVGCNRSGNMFPIRFPYPLNISLHYAASQPDRVFSVLTVEGI